MILSFKGQFINKILDGSKIHTIREDKSNRWKPGMKIHFATGVRTKNYKCFKTGVCTSVQSVRIIQGDLSKGRNSAVIIDGIDDADNIMWVSMHDGFDDPLDFLQWFSPNGETFVGKIIHWTNFKYEEVSWKI